MYLFEKSLKIAIRRSQNKPTYFIFRPAKRIVICYKICVWSNLCLRGNQSSVMISACNNSQVKVTYVNIKFEDVAKVVASCTYCKEHKVI